jgi:hypothetical protein
MKSFSPAALNCATAILFILGTLAISNARAQCVSYLPTGAAQFTSTANQSQTDPSCNTTTFPPQTLTQGISLQAYPAQVGLSANTVFSQCDGTFPTVSASVQNGTSTTTFMSANGQVTLTITDSQDSCVGVTTLGAAFGNCITWSDNYSLVVTYSLLTGNYSISGQQLFSETTDAGWIATGNIKFVGSGTLTIPTAPSMCMAAPTPPPLPGSQWYQNDSNWSSDQYDSVTGPGNTIGVQGCALTALTYSLNAAGQSYTPDTLNTTLSNLYPGDYSAPLSPVPGSGGRIILGSAVLDASFGRLKFDRSKSGSRLPSDLDSYLCSASPAPVIAQVTNPTSGHQHYIVVTGQQSGGTYSIVDPGYNPTGPNARTSLSDYDNQFQIVGVVKPPSGTDPSELDFSIVDNATLLVTAPDGSKTGVDPATGSALKASPQAAYYAIDNAVDTDQETITPTSTTYSAQLFLPVNGIYSVQVEGLRLGPYNLAVKALDVNGLPQTFATLPGVANAGSSSTFQIQFASASGGHTTVTVVATFLTALADVANSQNSGLITQPLIAKVLTDLLKIAQGASYRHDHINEAIERAALDVFKQVVIAETGKRLTGVAPQVLQSDATSLISQIP